MERADFANGEIHGRDAGNAGNALRSFGSVGTVVVQKIALFGRKIDCRPRYQFEAQLPAMVVVAAFAQGRSIFRNLEDWRGDGPTGLSKSIPA